MAASGIHAAACAYISTSKPQIIRNDQEPYLRAMHGLHPDGSWSLISIGAMQEPVSKPQSKDNLFPSGGGLLRQHRVGLVAQWRKGR